MKSCYFYVYQGIIVGHIVKMCESKLQIIPVLCAIFKDYLETTIF